MIETICVFRGWKVERERERGKERVRIMKEEKGIDRGREKDL